MKKNIKNNVEAHGNGNNMEATHETPKKGSKHDANLRKNSFYHFQIGLILAMLMVYAGLEASFAVKGENVIREHEELEEIVEWTPKAYTVEKKQQKTTQAKTPKTTTNLEKLEIVEDDKIIEDAKDIIEIPEDDGDIDLNIDTIQEGEDIVEVNDIPFTVIEDVPLFPGCEKVAKSKRRKCFNEEMKKHIRKHFRYPSLEEEMGIEGKVNVMFKIDVDGSITELQVRGPSKGLEKEATRIINKLPKMTPGKQRGKPVRVPFGQPITFKLN